LPSALPPSHQLTFEEFIEGNFNPNILDLGFLKPVFSRAFIDAHQLRYDETLRLGEDYEFYARAIALGARFLLLDGPAGYASVIRAGSLSTEHREEDLRRMRDCDDRLAIARPLTSAEHRTLRRHWVSVDCRLQWRRLISAVKAHDLGAAGSTFRSPQVARYLAARLAEQAWLRSVGRLFHKANT
jgi:succinoglycan biosynthesis protein ExoU